jgi:hypothetical protein
MAAVETVWLKSAWATAYMPMSNFMLPIVGLIFWDSDYFERLWGGKPVLCCGWVPILKFGLYNGPADVVGVFAHSRKLVTSDYVVVVNRAGNDETSLVC